MNRESAIAKCLKFEKMFFKELRVKKYVYRIVDVLCKQ